MSPSEFQLPPWDAPLDTSVELAAIPPEATMKGLFTLPMIVEAQRRRVTLASARPRYLPFADYPLVEHARILVESAQAFYPEVSLRRGLRRLGRSAQRVFEEATIGKVMWASVNDVDSALEAAAKSYAIAMPSSRVTILESASGRARVRLEGVHCFLDSNHVGTFEAVLRSCHTKALIAVRTESPSVGELLLTWPAQSVRPASGPPRSA